VDSSCICRLCEHCEHVWIAVSCSVKLFRNLEATLKGFFNRVLNFFPNARPSTQKDALEVLAMFSFRFLKASQFQTSSHTAVSHALRSSCQNELNDAAEGVLRAATKPGLAIEP
jgi:hypothetical protein